MKKIFFVLCMFFSIASVSASEDVLPICQSEAIVSFQLIGVVIYIIKILIPVMIIIIGSFSLGKAILTGDDKDTKKAFGLIVRKLIAGIIIFFVPTIINVVLNLVNELDIVQNKFELCSNCVFNPYGEICEEEVKFAKNCMGNNPSDLCKGHPYWGGN